MRAKALLLCVPLCLCLCLSACGGGEGSTQTNQVQAPQKGQSALERSLHANFPPPQGTPEAPGSQKAIEKGEAACEDKTPKQVVNEFAAKAKLSSEQREALKQIDTAEAHPTADFAAGQLAALAYEGSLPEDGLAEYGYRGCVYALAGGLEGRLGSR